MGCNSNVWLDYSFAIAFQVVLIGIFLTLFFFFFVSGVEVQEFNSQIDIIIDKILTPPVIDELTEGIQNKQQAALLIAGSMAVADQETIENSKSEVKEINCMNNAVRNKALAYCWIAVAALACFIFIAYAVGYCVPWLEQIQEALWVVLFVGFTELVFLELITKNFVSANPNTVRAALASGIQKWTNNCCDDGTCQPC